MFITQGPVPPTNRIFVGREVELKKMESWLRDVNCVGSLLGSRQTGKTSLLLKLRHRFQGKYHFVFIDLQAIEGADIAKCYSYMAKRVIEQLRDVLPPANYLQPNNNQGFLSFLQTISEQSRAIRIVILLDELGALPRKTLFQLAPRIRYVFTNRFMDHNNYEKYLFILSGATDMLDLIQGRNSPLNNVTESIYLSDFSKKESTLLLTKGLTELDVHPPQALYHQIHERTSGHPYLTQLAGTWLRQHHSSLTEKSIESLVEHLLQNEDKNLPHIRRALDAKAERWTIVSQIMQGTSISFERSGALAELELIGVIKNENGLCQIRNNLYRAALAQWLKSHHRLASDLPNNPDNEERINLLKRNLKQMPFWAFPESYRNTALILGRELYECKRFREARQALAEAHKAIECLRGQIQQQRDKQKLAAENAELYAKLVDSCLHDGEENAAFEYAVASKGRTFVDMLASTSFNIFAAGANDAELATDLARASQLRQQIDQLLSQSANDHEGKHKSGRQDMEQVGKLQLEEREYWQMMATKYPALTATENAPSLSTGEAQTLSAKIGATLVEFIQHAGGWSAFVVTAGTVRHVRLDGVNDLFIQDFVIEWIDQIEDSKYHTAGSYRYFDKWYKALIAPLELSSKESKDRLVLAPAGIFHLLPLSIARHPDTTRYLCDQYMIAFVPSLAALRVIFNEAHVKKNTALKRIVPQKAQIARKMWTRFRASFSLNSIRRSLKRKKQKEQEGTLEAPLALDSTLQTLLVAAYAGQPESPNDAENIRPYRYLPSVIPEAKAIASHFPSVILLHDSQATPQAVVDHAKNKDVLHFSCHGSFNSELAEQSGLALATGCLTVQRIITELHLSQTRLVTLSACNSHLVKRHAGEEHVGLVQAFMTAGAKCVIASLWKVDEQATRVLFEHFYGAVAAGERPTKALQQAIEVVRQKEDKNGHKIWQHPYYWAGFQVSGLGF